MSDNPPPTAETEQRGIGKSTIAKSSTAVLLLAALTTFALQNVGDVDVRFLGWDFAVPLIVVIAASALVGMVAWRVASLLRR